MLTRIVALNVSERLLIGSPMEAFGRTSGKATRSKDCFDGELFLGRGLPMQQAYAKKPNYHYGQSAAQH
jgi:hypothetical protein